jgi:hypothetical protein
MGIAYNAAIVRDNLVLCLDAANPKNYNLTEVEVLVVAGGGSGGVDNGGGGGAGGLIYNRNFAVTPGSAITTTVGGGGAARSGASDDGPGNNGGNSVFGSLTAYGGGAGSGWTNTTLPPGSSSYTGGNGAGQSASTSAGNSLGAGIGNRVTGTTTVASGQGNNGGTAVAAFAGGGGGSGGPGGNASSGAAGAGGLGYRTTISGVETVYAAGGAGGWDVLGGYSSSVPFTENGTVKKTTQTAEDSCPANTGHGGNGSNHNNNSSGAGGSGIVIVRYQGPQKAIGGTITSNNGYTIHTFTTSSTFTPLVATNNSAILGLSDFSGGGNFATSVNGPTYSSANGGSLVFDGVDDYVNAPNTSLIHRTSNWTYSCWVYFSGTPGLGTIFENGSWTSCLLIRFETNGITIYSMSTYWGKFTLTPTLGIWYKLDFIRNGNSIDFYLNGVYSQSLSFTADIQPSSNLFIGMSQHSAGQCFNGRISQTQIYNRALTESEIQQNYNALKSRFGLP